MTTSRQVRIVIAEDHIMVRSGLVMGLETFPEIQVVGEAGTGEEALRLCEDLKPDVLIMDIRMPKMDGITAMQIMHQKMPLVRVLVLTSYYEPDLVHDAVLAGASGYLFKDASLEELADAVGNAYLGITAFSENSLRCLAEAAGAPDSHADSLDLIERQVLELLLKDKMGPEIMELLHISSTDLAAKYGSIIHKLSAGSEA